MPELPQGIGFMSVLEPVFTKPAFIIFIRLVVGWILCPARRAITGMDPFADPKRENRVDVYCSVKSQSLLETLRTATTPSSAPPPGCNANCSPAERAAWSGRLAANQKNLLLAIDDTVHKKTGRKADGARVCRDAVRSTASETAFCRAWQYVPPCLVSHPPRGGEPLAIPVNIRLNRKISGLVRARRNSSAKCLVEAPWAKPRSTCTRMDGRQWVPWSKAPVQALNIRPHEHLYCNNGARSFLWTKSPAIG
ncbi:MAG: hypothetical protein LBE84_05360 [Planctomycetota bacterium]|nr:hypothetical protein [Planctomycetota bacterium]